MIENYFNEKPERILVAGIIVILIIYAIGIKCEC